MNCVCCLVFLALFVLSIEINAIQLRSPFRILKNPSKSRNLELIRSDSSMDKNSLLQQNANTRKKRGVVGSTLHYFKDIAVDFVPIIYPPHHSSSKEQRNRFLDRHKEFPRVVGTVALVTVGLFAIPALIT
jgi:hypothetical protein